jgi:hypothetical protein
MPEFCVGDLHQKAKFHQGPGFDTNILIHTRQNETGRAQATPRIKQPCRTVLVWFPLHVTLVQPLGEWSQRP